MSAATSPHREFETSLLERLANSERFRVYQDAFRTATGLPLRLVPSDPDAWCLDDQKINRSPFCEALNACDSACGACIETNRRLMKEAETKGPMTCHCFAGLCATAVPVKMGASVVGYLKTGQVFSRTPSEDQFEQLLGAIGRRTITDDARDKLKQAYLQTRHVEPSRYQSMVTLLTSFAEQLAEQAESLAIIDEGSEPAAIARARKFIHAHLDQPLPLGLVARHAGLSESHFCRLFKESAGLTLTDYVNRCRIDWAKRELLKPEARISEIAFLVGYQSLSQFNRSFARIVGVSPTIYRRSRLERVAS
ncbi:MAG: PocR ligand-binding domain-containing protein [Akkermansiaceae bacterium]|nr:PocR ligand-binding domain-containing protein [Akkermansiaceae bacterium]MCP5542781.1 PocR ligand-binding domain-containing protein [Akkermansiaceae bacterium]